MGIMSTLALCLCIIILIGSAVASDVPFVFDNTASGVAGYTSDKIEKISTSSSDLAGVPQAATPSNDEILEFPNTGGGDAPGKTTETKVEVLNKTINSKVEPDNDAVYRMAHRLAALHNGDFTIDQVDEIYSYLKYGNDSIRAWSYSRDERGVDKFNSASESLSYGNHAKCVGSGDCDDFAILIASLVEAIGGTTRVIFARNNSTGGHAYTEVFLGRLDDSNGNVEEIIDWLKQNYDTDKIFTHIDTDTRDVWLNLDWGPDEKGNAHPGGPFFKGDRHYIIFVRDSFAKAPMKPPEKSNKPPKLLSLKSDKSSPQEIGTEITWTAEARDLENDQLQYRFFLNNDPMTKWQTHDECTWKSMDFDLGENQIEVRVRDGKHSGPNGYDSNKIVSFDIAEVKLKASENYLPIIDSLMPDKVSPQEAGNSIVWMVTAKDADNDQISYRFFLNDQPATGWQSEAEWSWKTSEADVGNNQVEVRIRDGKHTGPEGYDDSIRKSFKINVQSRIPIDGTTELVFHYQPMEAIDRYDIDTPRQQTIINGLRISFQLGQRNDRARWQGQDIPTFNALVDEWNSWVRANFGEDPSMFFQKINVPDEPITASPQKTYSSAQKTIIDGLRLSYQLGEAYYRAMQEGDISTFNALVDEWNSWVRANIREQPEDLLINKIVGENP
jgi:hypothetical protein